MFSSLKVREFRIYWLGMFVSLVGTWIQTIAQSWLVFQLTHSSFLLGVVGFLGFIPVFILSLFGGVVADRFNRRNTLLFTQSAFMLLAFLLAISTQLRLITPRQIMLFAVLNGIVMAFDAPSRQSVVVDLVGKAQLLNAIALNSIAFNSSRIIGPALAGILIASIGMSGCFYVNGISFLAVIIALLLIKINHSVSENKNTNFSKDLIVGLNFIKNNLTILILIVMVGVTSLFGISYVILMPVFASDILKAGAKGLGILMSAVGIGALIAGLVLARIGDFKHKGRLLINSAIIFSVSLVFLALSKTYLFSIITLIILGWSSVTAISLINTLLQTLAPDEVRGRLMSAFMFTFAGIMPFGNLIAGSLAQKLGVSVAIMTSGIACTIFFLLVNSLYPQIGKI
ncbi:MAG: MFS transporter [Candidatus Omnitrophica bacterium]|nr:MFS transporter [Candidatus Omnitrophota bacterium]